MEQTALDSLKEAGFEPEEMISFIKKGKMSDFTKKYDAVMILADVTGFARKRF